MKTFFRLLFKVVCYTALIVPVYFVTLYVLQTNPFMMALWLLGCILLGGVIKPLIDLLTNKIFDR
ncbi:hypothetical protein [Ulvibacterium sp.]|uniref:hypothetical protein n=1 Tax=Ulvibacterium sp. TaxID=2665914 RepID=UPI003BAA7B20